MSLIVVLQQLHCEFLFSSGLFWTAFQLVEICIWLSFCHH